MSKLKELYQQKLAELEKIKIALEVEEQYLEHQLPKVVTQDISVKTFSVPISDKTNSIDLMYKKGGKMRLSRYEALNLPPNHAYVVVDKK